MAAENPTWGEERIADELWLKFQIRLSPRTVGKYVKRLPRPPGGKDQRWSTFLRNRLLCFRDCMLPSPSMSHTGSSASLLRACLANRDYYETQNYFESRMTPDAPVIARIHGMPAYPLTAVAG